MKADAAAASALASSAAPGSVEQTKGESSAALFAPGGANETYRLDEPGPPHPRALSLRRDVLEQSPLAVVEIDMERRVRYANPAALRMLGAPADYLGLALDSVFVDDASQQKIDQEIARRRKGLIGNYRVTARRLSDGREIPIEITGLPIMDDRGQVVISIGLFRSLEEQALADAIRKIGSPGQNPDELLMKLAETLKGPIPYDRMSVSRMSSDMGHVQRFFSHGWDIAALGSKRWWALTDAQKQWYATEGSTYIPDLEKFFDDPVWAPFKTDPVVKEILRAGIRSVLRRDVHRDGRTLCSITLMSRELDGYDPERRELFMSAPVGGVVLQAYEHYEKKLVAQRLELLKGLNRCTTVAEACQLLAHRLVDTFDWSHVSIFRVDRSARTVRLLAQHWQSDDPIRLPQHYEQPQALGVLGRVVTTGQAQNVGNVHHDPDYVRSVKSGRVLSELCVPVFSKSEPGVRWIINVEDEQENAFASDELAALQEVAEEVGAMMQRISDLFFLTQCFEHASEAIFVTDAHLGLRRVNPAAAHLLGFKDAAKVKGNLCDYLADPAACTRLSAPAAGDLGEFLVKQTGVRRVKAPGETRRKSAHHYPTVPVFVSRRDFPEGLTGSIFIARDTSAMRKTVQAAILEKAAYSIAAETCTPLSAAISDLERLGGTAESNQAPNRQALQRVLRQLSRVQQSYRRLAMFDAEARPKPSLFALLNVQSELEALARNLADSGRITIEPPADGKAPLVQGDHFQVNFVLETLLIAMLRYAPEAEPVVARLSVADGAVNIQLRGYLDAAIPEQQLDAPWVASDADMAIAKPLIDEFVANHHGTWGGAVRRDRRAEIDIRLPLSSQ
jgi:PAS domain S-box-containing protein